MQEKAQKSSTFTLGRAIAEKTMELAAMQEKSEPRQLTEAEMDTVSGGKEKVR